MPTWDVDTLHSPRSFKILPMESDIDEGSSDDEMYEEESEEDDEEENTQSKERLAWEKDI